MERKFRDYILKYGTYRITYEDDVVTGIVRIVSEISEGEASGLSDRVVEELSEYFEGQRTEFDFRYRAEGTEFQMMVWNACKSIGYGDTLSYRDIAELIGKPGAVRAVGTALRLNPLQIVIPCHRIVKADGSPGNYAGGIAVKKRLLALERCSI